MCGLAGIAGRTAEKEQIRAALRCVEHRGPDDHGVYEDSQLSLVHTRLSIIDPSRAGHQPMKDEATGVVIACNGEIYNYRELRLGLDGEDFRSQSDTEVVLRLYLRHGITSINMLRGMFALVIWDPRTRTLHLCRDRFGIKPLYYHHEGDVLAFSSEIKGLTALGVPVSLNRKMVYEYLRYGLTAHNQETFFDQIFGLEPGTILTFREGRIEKTTYWTPHYLAPDEQTSTDIEEEVWEALQEAVGLHLVSDVPIGISLSSGLDSRFLVNLLGKLGRREFHTFTWGYDEPEYDEIIRLEDAEFPSTLERHHLRVRPEEMLDSLQRAIHYFELPLGGLGTLAAYQLMQVPQELGIKVLLSGEGADETFGGYKYYYYSYFRDLSESGQMDLLQWELDCFARTNGERMEIGSPDFRRQVLNESTSVRAPDGTSLGGLDFIGPGLTPWAEEDTGETSETAVTDGLDQLRTAMVRDLTQWKIPKLLWFQDRASMAWGVETRVPFLDHKLVELAYRLPANLIIRDGVSKYLLKHMLQRFCGVDLSSTIKHYVSAPQREWLKGPQYQAVNRYLDEGILAQSNLVNYEAWKSAYAEYAKSPELGNSFFVWKMVNLEALLREFFQNDQPLVRT